MPLCILPRYLQLNITIWKFYKLINKRLFNTNNITIVNRTQVKQEGGGGSDLHQSIHFYDNSSTENRLNCKSNIADLEKSIFTQGLPSDAVKHEDSVKVFINYAQRKYSTGIYLRQEIRDGKVWYLVLPAKPTKNKNQ